MGLTRKLAVGLGTIAALLVLNQIFEYGVGDFFVNPYYARIINLIGINITLAVSLNLINGLAGQFSIGHAGFMAVGGYTATYVTVYHGAAMARLVGQHGHRPRRRFVVMVVSLAAARWPRPSPGSPSAFRRCASRATTSPSSRSASARSSASSS